MAETCVDWTQIVVVVVGGVTTVTTILSGVWMKVQLNRMEHNQHEGKTEREAIREAVTKQ